MPTKITSLITVPAIRNYLERIGAEPRSLTEAIIKTQHGKYSYDTVRIMLDPTSGVIKTWDSKIRKASTEYAPTDEEAQRIKDQLIDYYFPRSKHPKHYTLPENLSSAAPGTVFEFKDRDGALMFVVQRVDSKTAGDKVYYPWTLFDDDEWRQCEPGGKLSLYGLERLGQRTTVFIHEGPKKAWFCNKLFHDAHTDEEIAARDAHPWKDEMTAGIHLGWHGGALSPHRTDWDVLQRAGVKNVYIIPDNDAPGMNAVPKISEHLRKVSVYCINFGKKFPASFDMADPWPKEFEGSVPGTYTGPAFEDLLQPANWATDLIDQGKKKPIAVLREEFAHPWRFCADQDQYINIRFPFMCYTQTTFDKMIRPFSDSDKTSTLLNAHFQTRAFRMVYRPDEPEQLIYDNQAPIAVNVHVPSHIKSVAGNSQPFEDFLDYFFVKPDECDQAKRIIATLIAHPEIRIQFGQLWVSETHGTGKNTLGEHILIPLIGRHNCSMPNENMIVESTFNSWLVKKRLVFVPEIYAGHSWKAYNKLKPLVTDRTLTVNEKYVREYPIDNWAHFICCSNDEEALKIEDSDRRWFCPKINPVPWKEPQWEKFYAWIKGGGLSIIKHWAENFGDYVHPRENAPSTEFKKQIIEWSLASPIRALMSWCDAFRKEHNNVEMVVSNRIIKMWLEQECKEDLKFFKPQKLRRTMEKFGWVDPNVALTIDGMTQMVIMSPAAAIIWNTKFADSTDDIVKQEGRDWLRKHLRSMSDPDGRGAEFIRQAKIMGV